MSHTFIGDPSVPLGYQEVATRVGAALISALALNLKDNCVQTVYGEKYPAGLARLVWDIIEQEITRDQ